MRRALIILPFLSMAGNLWAYRQMVIFEKGTGKVEKVFYQGGFSSPDYEGRDDVVFDPDLKNLEGVVATRYWKVSNMRPREMTAPEKLLVDSAEVRISTP